ncbi:MAG TPA: phasin family protein [Rhodocyclaceae bacterium]|nr:phasin family protein [Rhodocyclaceae bacterium]
MYSLSRFLVAANKATLETALSLGNIAFTGVERVATLNLNMARLLIEESIANARELLASKDVRALLNLQSALVQPSLEKFSEYSRDMYSIAYQTQDELIKAVESNLADFNKEVIATLDQLGKSQLPGADRVAAALKSTIAAVNAAYDMLVKSIRQLGHLLNLDDADVQLVTLPLASAVGSIAKTGKKAAKAAPRNSAKVEPTPAN